MEEWQNQMRQQQEHSRRYHDDAKEVHRTFRGKGTPPPLLKKIREEELQKKRDAQESLRNYQAQKESVILASTPAAAAKLRAQSMNDSNAILPPVILSNEKDVPSEKIAKGTVSSLKASYNVVEQPQQQQSQQRMDSNTSFQKLDQWENIESSSSTTQQQQQQQRPQAQLQGGDDWIEVNTEDCSQLQNQQQQLSPEGFPQNLRLNINIEFGIITNRLDPLTDAYMEAFGKILAISLRDNEKTKGSISFYPAVHPTVLGMRQDESFVDSAGRDNIVRLLVKVTVPIFLLHGVQKGVARDTVIDILRQAVQDGTFLALVLDGSKK